MYTQDAFLIDGRWTPPAGTRKAHVISPSTEEEIGWLPDAVAADMDAAIVSARRAFDQGPWPRMSIHERITYLARLADALRPRLEQLVRLQVSEVGVAYSFNHPLTEQRLNSIAAHTDAAVNIPLREVRAGTLGKVLVYREPVGVVAGIIPWNGPIPMLLSRMLPALLTGCPVVMKPSPESPLSSYIVAEAVIEADFPPGVVNIVPGGREAGESLVTHRGVDKVSFTGSSATGARVAALCGNDLRRVTLELGGKSAAVILEDADLDQHMSTLVTESMLNNGQACYATTRILAPKSIAGEVTDRVVGAVSRFTVGDPHDKSTDFGPLAASRQRDRVESYIQSGRDEGARIAMGGGRPAGLDRGWYVEPTVFTGVKNSMRIAQEEIFGPVVCIIEYESEDEAVAIANDSIYGLGGAVFTSDIERGIRVAERIHTGSCRINDGPAGGGGGPFGGMKKSGIGREYGREGFEGYFELKSVTLPRGYEPAA
jgi:aldehyde dehydrogenase (NAD+)